ncbi:hypothetical protein [Pseudonocardia sp. MH-G8]|uniref:hypothetical protein n=1 Tax=Pseudonocardia sp. MH-G8 TaxID=1854588 RepID=UPI000B9FB706|nr:hypothetical protein [Pseudonocardia sp. MH-G8]OZM76593.1 hypothetical protein CFP66_40590 [Pseudonocardia sp. MH-G8]
MNTSCPAGTDSAPRYPGSVRARFSAARLHLPPGTTAAVRTSANGNAATYLRSPDGGWAEINHDTERHGQHDARVAGPTNLLAPLRTAHDTHHDLDRPDLTDFGVTATARGPAETTATVVWHRNPDTGYRREVHPAPVRLGALT